MLFLFSLVVFYYDLPSKIYVRITKKNPSIAHADCTISGNKKDAVRRSYFKIYPSKNTNIVMLGDSITHQIDWNELLDRPDIVNRGIGRDTTRDIINRLSDIYTLHPKICFIMCGLNDIFKKIPVEIIFNNYKYIVENIKKNNIVPVIQSTLYVTKKYNKNKEVNEKIYALNQSLREYANKENTLFIDINQKVSINKNLCSKYSYDGKHLLGEGYMQWRELLEPSINKLRPDLAKKPHDQSAYLPGKRLSFQTN